MTTSIPERISSDTIPVDAWSPFRYTMFRWLWIATVVSNIGTWFQEVGVAWLMTSLTPSPLMVALVQTATTLPVMLFALPAGALSDILDRRRMLIFAVIWHTLAALLLAVSTLVGATTALVLLLFTFLFGIGTALTQPAWQAIVPELVPREHLPPAVALNSAGINVARAIGPAIAGVVIASFGVVPAFFLNAVSFAGVLWLLYNWKRLPVRQNLPPEPIGQAVWTGLRYVRFAPQLRNVLIRTALFIIFGSALWALLPLIARQQLGVGAGGYGMLLGAIGVGALIATALLPRVRPHTTTDTLVIGASIMYAVVMLVAAISGQFIFVFAMLLFGGMAWLTLLSTFQTNAQLVVTGWIRGRAMATYFIVFFGGMAGGSLLWGTIAEFVGISTAMLLATAGLVIGLLGRLRFPLGQTDQVDTTPSTHQVSHTLDQVAESERTNAPVLVMIHYRIDPAQWGAFLQAINELGVSRQRSGAMRWEVYRSLDEPEQVVEQFVVSSWMAHMRQHERETMDDHQIHKRVNAFHQEEEPPLVRHFIAPDKPDTYV